MVAVTGSNGFIGQGLLNSEAISGIPIDLRLQSDNEIRRLLASSQSSTIVHLANPMPSKHENSQKRIHRETIALSKRLLRIIEPIGNFHIIFPSSIRVYGKSSSIIRENSPLLPMDGYGSGKLAAEKILSSSLHKFSCIRATSIQGLDPKGIPRGIVGVFARQAKHKGCITVMGSGKSVKDLLHISDLNNLLSILIKNKIKLKKFVLPAGGGKNSISVLDLAKRVADRTGTSIRHVAPDEYDLSGKVDNTPIQLLTGWKPRFKLEKMIEEAVSAV